MLKTFLQNVIFKPFQSRHFFFERLKSRNSMRRQSLVISRQSSRQLGLFKGLFPNFRINRPLLIRQFRIFRERHQSPTVGGKGREPEVLSFRLCPLTSSFCFPSETLPFTLFWSLFLHVKRLHIYFLQNVCLHFSMERSKG